ncbi:transcription termination factor Rho, partial [bacterium]|nr:transcription termination factor Rho [bacterium]
MNYSQYSREHFEQMPLYELRIVGRNLGVKQPTSKVKADLIDEICKILTQKPNTQENTSQEPQKKRQGRPPRTVLTFSDIAAENEEKGEISKIRILEGITTKLEDAFNETPSAVSSCCKSVKKKEEQKTERKVVCEKKEPDAITEVENTGADIPSTDAALADVASTEVANTDVVEIKEGVLEIMPDGYGFLRAKNYESGEHDAYIAAQKIKRSGLRKGDWIRAEAKKNCENRPAGVVNILEVNGRPAEMAFRRKNFDYLTPIYPDHRFKLEIANQQNDYAIRSIDMVAPIGKGQRAMIVSPPKAGKTTLLKKIAHSISHNYPKAHLIVLLIDERPEEVTDMQRSIEGEVVYSTFDEMPEHHTKAAELVLERAKRLVEMGDDVVILMDSLTRLARAYNLT